MRKSSIFTVLKIPKGILAYVGQRPTTTPNRRFGRIAQIFDLCLFANKFHLQSCENRGFEALYIYAWN